MQTHLRLLHPRKISVWRGITGQFIVKPYFLKMIDVMQIQSTALIVFSLRLSFGRKTFHPQEKFIRTAKNMVSLG